MTKLRIPCNKISCVESLLKKPYSVQKIGSEFEYQIITYGFEHLIPEVLLYELSNGTEKFWSKINSVKRGLHLFHLNTEEISKIQNIRKSYSTSEILNFEYVVDKKTVIISSITPLKKLSRATDPLLVATSILDACFTGLELEYTKNHEYATTVVFDFKEVNPTFCTTLPLLYPLQKDRMVEIPSYNLFFTTLEEALLYTLECKYANINVSMESKEKPPLPFSMFKYLRSLDLKEHYFLNIRNCGYCTKLLNPLSINYSTFCKDPFLCELKSGKLKNGWTVIQNEVKVWTNKIHLKDTFKTALLTWIPGVNIKNRQDSGELLNEIFLDEKPWGGVTFTNGVYVFSFSDKSPFTFSLN